MEQAAESNAYVLDCGAYVRVSVPAPDDGTAYRALLDVLLMADAWGSSDASGGPLVWATVLTGPDA
jgi:hypothetical protein